MGENSRIKRKILSNTVNKKQAINNRFITKLDYVYVVYMLTL